ncbi:MAG: neutral/alkaline non-lysosomal ceramidase N-terminal domain-containing protein [Myxococcales bacterium]|nr:neutral/alkaline non-lysosomal ceramidase N-terminal domain-containing protein [Myxococcales bacterium]
MRTFPRIVVLSAVLAACSVPPIEAVTEPPPAAESCAYDVSPARSGAGQLILPGAVLAGTGEARIDLPVGTPLGGFTSRMKALGGQAPDGRRSPHAKAFVPSAGVQTVPLVRALYLQAGSEPTILVKADLCVAFDRLVFDLEKELIQAGMASARGRVIVTASHTHAGPGTFQGTFHLSLGFDLFQEEQYQRLLQSAAQAVLAARQAAKPAKLGAGIWDGWDRGDDIYADRRKEDDSFLGPDGKPMGKHKEQRLLVLRIDDEADQPLAVVTSFPMHGTVGGGDNPLVSTDATGHVELALEERFDRPVMVMHIQGPAGDVSPQGRGGLSRCDAKTTLCENFAKMESIGELAAPRIIDLWRAVKTSSRAALEVGTRSVRNGRDVSVRSGLSYTPYDPAAEISSEPSDLFLPDGTARGPIRQFNVPVAAGLCGDKKPTLPVDGISGAKGAPYASCAELGAAQRFIAAILKVPEPPLPTCETTRTTLSALRLSGIPLLLRSQSGGGAPTDDKLDNETLLLATLPGEPVTRLADALRKKSPAGADRTFVIGYAQGHIGYLLDVENWLRGGYEPSINIFGPLEGEWLLERSLDLLRLVHTPEREDPEAQGVGGPPQGGRFDRLQFLPRPVQTAPRSSTSQAGQVPTSIPSDLFVRTHDKLPSQAQPVAQLPRVSGRATFVFYGGDPEEDFPQVSLEYEKMPGSGLFSEVRSRSGRVVGSRGRDILLTYTPSPVDVEPGKSQAHFWTVEWQAVGFSLGSATGLDAALALPLGRYRFSVVGQSGSRPYHVTSQSFVVTAEGAVQLTARREGARITGQAVYPVGSGFRLLRLQGGSDGSVPVTGAVKLLVRSRKDGKSEALSPAVSEGSFAVDVSVDVSAGVDLEVEDAAGNRGTLQLG